MSNEIRIERLTRRYEQYCEDAEMHRVLAQSAELSTGESADHYSLYLMYNEWADDISDQIEDLMFENGGW